MSLLTESSKTIDRNIFTLSETVETQHLQAQDITTVTLDAHDITTVNLDAHDITTVNLTSTDIVTATLEGTTIASNRVNTVELQVAPASAMTNGFLMSSDNDGLTVWKKPAYGYSAGDSSLTINSGDLFSFNIDSDSFPNYGFTSNPGVNGTSYVVAQAGTYEYSFSINCVNGNGDNVSCEAGLSVNGTVSAGHYSRSPLANGDNYELWLFFSGLISLAVGDVVALRNTNSLHAVFNNGFVNRTLKLKQIDFQ